MVASRALAAIRQHVTVEWPRIAEADAKALLIRVAREGHDRIMRDQALRAGVIPEWEAYANTPGNSNLESVRLPGPIVYKYRYLREIVIAAIRELERQSPVESGRYKRSHTLWVNGVAVPLDTPIKAGDEVFIANPVPYARRLEIGRRQTGEPFLLQVENRIYERVAKNVLIPRYRNAAAISFGYVTLPGAWVIKGGLPPTYPIEPFGNRHRRRRQHVGEKVQAPAIFIGSHS